MRIQQSSYYLHRQRLGLRQSALWFCFRCLPVLLGCLLVTLLLSASVARADAEEQVSELPGGGHLLLGSSDKPYTAAVTQASKVHFDISGMVAVVTLEQSFSNDSADWVEGVYGFPLPERAAVRYMEIAVGERRIIGKVREKAEAKAIYKAAKEAGKKASLVEQQRPNLFSNRIANIGPGETITVRLEYVQAVDYIAGQFSLRFPMTITPRYMPGRPLPGRPLPGRPLPGRPLGAGGRPPEEQTLALNPYLGWAVATDEVPDAGAISPLLYPQPGSDQQPLNPVVVTASLDMGMPLASVDSPYHDISLARSGESYTIALARGKAEMDRDFVLNWQPVSGSAPTAALFTEQVDGEHYGLLMLVPPISSAAPGGIPRELIFVVDTSGSMGGVSIAQARESVSMALRQLGPADRFNIIEFNSHYRALYRSPVPASAQHVQQALEFVRRLDANGGTEMLPALRAALAPPGVTDQFVDRPTLRQVIFITDGAVGNEAALFEEIAARLGDNRLFTVGIGSAPNSWFMRKAADFGRGVHTHIGDINEVAEKMSELFEYLSQPVAVDLAVDWPLAVEAWPAKIPDLYRGHPLLLSVNFGDQAPSGLLTVSADIAGHPWSQRLQLASADASEGEAGHRGVASLWARQKISSLLDLKVQGESEESVRAGVLPVALQHQLLSPYTSFVAVEEIVSRPAGEGSSSTPVANTRPRGQSPQPYAYPSTATSGPAQLWLGMLLLFGALIVRLMRQQEVDYVPAR